ncbi:3'(2'),5'-bisphosphate nucleotidase CysQ [Pseudomonas syringae]|uniref:3'(2'),5'-bisphosphate nucleotidase CysQ n=11 Tax=Pseudomonas syringae TaxID=317 RepID=A0A3M4LCE8_PSESF|nr:3'(2'),5'-bisphosphate nucleotidase CysQ [Pseudomonas syringae]EPM50531.1 3'(2'),5'-bisphosphate nucleotidase [Pseudomonas syringae pv. actinidiae ICMP 19098]EPN20696.1 3'(2'),5'-bisphosphate nucleotidase [Pseudomonas syringae pv. actinidiae ICMP 19100]EPN28340.1 3'(2'),5'-bisphosphate nucleotidase [Pseudomonas syringae pv. actinidiae ICMP 19099]EPN36554.1 3'(2'),5'-bisphosphate nucleotidase [Pseudomonas syringae pv. actinidiae ICMP 18883]EPN49137.1 3'(2'),5'-bisphosphate nucleotidase [Pseu
MTHALQNLPHPLLAPVIELARLAGEVILPFWRANVTVTTKTDDSPVTAADLAAHQVLVEGLQALDPGIHVLSEEDADIPLSERASWERWWLVDPLDGTKEFISGSEEFTVNVALIEHGRVVFGVVSMPTNNRCYFGGAGLGAWRSDDTDHVEPIAVRNQPGAGQTFTVVASRRHTSPEQEHLLAGLANGLGPLQLTNIGSSLKFCLLAEGAADCYPRLAPTSQWDTAAAQGVLEGAGGAVLQLDGQPFSYPARESLLNPFFLALPANAAWRDKLLVLAQS